MQYYEWLNTVQAFNIVVIVPVLTHTGVVSTAPNHPRGFFVEISNTWASFERTIKIVAPRCWHTHSPLFRDSEALRVPGSWQSMRV
jgi:hypothetical protein